MAKEATEQKATDDTQAKALTILSIALLSCYHIKHCWQEAIWLYFKRIQAFIVGHNRTKYYCNVQPEKGQRARKRGSDEFKLSYTAHNKRFDAERTIREAMPDRNRDCRGLSSNSIAELHQQPCITTKMTSESVAQNAEAPFDFRSNGLVSAFRGGGSGGGVGNNTHSPSHNSFWSRPTKKTNKKSFKP